MGWKQIKSFDPNAMGNRKGYCLQNVAKGFHIYPSPDPSASAKQDCERNAAKGTLHRDSNFPTQVAVPVYIDTASPYEHVIVADHGVYWSDGKRLSSLSGLTVIGWGEWCNGFQIVESTPDPVPPAPSGFLPAKGYWCRGDKDPRIAQEASFMRKTFPAYTPAAALGPVYGQNLEKAVKEFQRRTGLKADGMTGPITYEKMRQYGFRPNC
jgi:peptidoglycan hydrolase-like protein with peptidoglycan-binding domain